MKQEDRELLLKDLCARLPYGVKLLDTTYKKFGASDLIDIGVDGSILVDNKTEDIQYHPIIDKVKPYLRSMSNMLEEERTEYFDIKMQEIERVALAEVYRPEAISIIIDWLNLHHFDYRGLIEKELAIEAPKTMYK